SANGAAPAPNQPILITIRAPPQPLLFFIEHFPASITFPAHHESRIPTTTANPSAARTKPLHQLRQLPGIVHTPDLIRPSHVLPSDKHLRQSPSPRRRRRLVK
ncbi:hypothetical protein LINGRAHAP2_LOCUS16484, partial [Linum grandiflorum]